MPSGHRLRDVADQSGLSLATVDRVLHRRPGVSARAVRQVEQALLDLDQQQRQLRLGARTLMIDLVMQAPERFSSAVREALEGELDGVRPAAVRARFDLRESGDVASLVARLDAVGRRGRTSHGVLLKAPDDPAVAAAVDRCAQRGIPVVTLVTDVHDCARIGYVGLDNRAAGATAAYLVDRWLGDRPGSVLTTVSRAAFFGERERREAFVAHLAQFTPCRRVVAADDADGLDPLVAEAVRQALQRHPDVVAVYSMGGGNRSVLDQFTASGHEARVFVAHDLDRDNVDLLLEGRVSAVLHHDLRVDMRAALRQVLRHHGLLPGAPASVRANVQVVTPFNLPARWSVR